MIRKWSIYITFTEESQTPNSKIRKRPKTLFIYKSYNYNKTELEKEKQKCKKRRKKFFSSRL